MILLQVIVIDDESSPVKKVVTAKLVLSKNPLVEVSHSVVVWNKVNHDLVVS